MCTRLGLLVALLALGQVAIAQAVAQDNVPPPVGPKYALLIGNANYDREEGYTPSSQRATGNMADLRNPCNDVILIESKLIQLKWDKKNILMKCDATTWEINELVQEFAGNYMSSKHPFGFIYYAGHGAQVGSDTYIFGVNAVEDIEKVASRYMHSPRANLFPGGMKLREAILDQVGEPGKGNLFVVLDACRDNPVFDQLRLLNIPVTGPTVSGDEPILGMKFLYSTTRGKVAGDGLGGNSPFATIFASQVMSATSVDYLIRAVVTRVYTQTSDPEQRAKLYTNVVQMPEESGTLQEPPPDACFAVCP
jgi:uncharacterized caspase-like protein